jgi:hypothetical protein
MTTTTDATENAPITFYGSGPAPWEGFPSPLGDDDTLEAIGTGRV